MTISTYSTYQDEELLVFLRGSDSAAFTEIYNRYHKPVYKYLISLVKVPQLTEDLLHEVFLKLWENREKIEIRESFSGYLFRICHNKAADMIRKIAGERSLKMALLLHYQGFTPDEYRSREELQRFDNLVEQALDSLSPQRRKVYELCRRQEKSYQEVAAELGISTNTVKEHMAKALSTLRNFLEEKGKFTFALLLLEKFL
jgi:RNA polymerase sigma-70 factor (ECF subfamily)